jgi:L-iditol 2-dehydrogenase
MKNELPKTMLAARLHGPRDLRIEEMPHPGLPGRGNALIRVGVTGVCGSDLHSYQDARVGDTVITSPLILGHEFAGEVAAVGEEALDGRFRPLRPETRVAVDPAQPCAQCEMCEQGHPNLCLNLRFCATHPYDGSLCEWMHMPARSCFPLPESIDDLSGALLEPLGVAIHAVDLARIRVADRVVIVGAGPIGLCILQVALLAGASPVFVTDTFEWRLQLVERFGGVPIPCDADEGVAAVLRESGGRGVDVAIEAAWADSSVEAAARMTRLGGRLVLVGIPADDRLLLNHSNARRKGLTIRLCRRMKHVYPRAIEGKVKLLDLVSHRFALSQASQAFALNSAYQDEVVKVMIETGSRNSDFPLPGAQA